MADPNGEYLFVNLSASQTRRRLKGFGHGVRKIQSAGKNRAIIIHTATGEHFNELENQFGDVGFSTDEKVIGESVENVRNIGTESAAWLRDVGIKTRAELENAGPILAYQLVKQQHPSASLKLLWAIAAGIQNRDWRELTNDDRQRLLKDLP
ncbi:hypothetical protein CA13_69560 [Planctomycetes bacterium CA13]|uniref:TfoX C-terminal domain-containing protein n=1 Tax=Novipirellula herctigrandis TaxID=2527986 RepID=A0A5C5YND4_9BACT|nr:hypothetical protein CA13_69560 [Planctomycetes bacterium CA13]